MSWFTELLADAGVPTLVAMAGETITYRPAAGGTRSISAIVERDSHQSIDGLQDTSSPRLVVTVANDSTTGISSSEIDVGGDSIDVSFRVGETASTRDIAAIINHDAAAVVFEVR